MKHVQKLVLVPVERWEKIGDNIPVKEVTVTSVRQKNVSLQKNVSHQKNPVSQVMKVKLKNQQGMGKRPIKTETPMFHFLTQEKRNKATKLFQFLTKHKIFSLNHNGEIVQNGKTMHESNILQLITHAVQNISSSPIGIKYFYKTLKKRNVPEKYISNKMGRKIMNKSLPDETSKWRPPGRLHKLNQK